MRTTLGPESPVLCLALREWIRKSFCSSFNLELFNLEIYSQFRRCHRRRRRLRRRLGSIDSLLVLDAVRQEHRHHQETRAKKIVMGHLKSVDIEPEECHGDEGEKNCQTEEEDRFSFACWRRRTTRKTLTAVGKTSCTKLIIDMSRNWL